MIGHNPGGLKGVNEAKLSSLPSSLNNVCNIKIIKQQSFFGGEPLGHESFTQYPPKESRLSFEEVAEVFSPRELEGMARGRSDILRSYLAALLFVLLPPPHLYCFHVHSQWHIKYGLDAVTAHAVGLSLSAAVRFCVAWTSHTTLSESQFLLV